MTPFHALNEYTPPLLQHIPVPFEPTQVTATDVAEKENMVALLQQNLARAQLRMKKYADSKRTERTFEMGDMVYLR
jgi:hypothetical protein